MGKIKGFILNRKQYERIRKMDHGQMKSFYESVYMRGFEAGKRAAEGLSDEKIKHVLLQMKGVGEKRSSDILEALTRAKGERKTMENG